jgi:hypothetical protein
MEGKITNKAFGITSSGAGKIPVLARLGRGTLAGRPFGPV